MKNEPECQGDAAPRRRGHWGAARLLFHLTSALPFVPLLLGLRRPRHSSASGRAGKTYLHRAVVQNGRYPVGVFIVPIFSRVEVTQCFQVPVCFTALHARWRAQVLRSEPRRTRRPQERGDGVSREGAPSQAAGWSGLGCTAGPQRSSHGNDPWRVSPGDWLWGSLRTPEAPQAQPSPRGWWLFVCAVGAGPPWASLEGRLLGLCPLGVSSSLSPPGVTTKRSQTRPEVPWGTACVLDGDPLP